MGKKAAPRAGCKTSLKPKNKKKKRSNRQRKVKVSIKSKIRSITQANKSKNSKSTIAKIPKTMRQKTKLSGFKAGFTRDDKTDFTQYWVAHRYQMNANGCEVDRMIELRRKIHQNAEGGFEVHQTVSLLIETLSSFGIAKSAMKKIVGTGLVVDIMGTAPPEKKEDGPKLIALRTELDALPMVENNQNLAYRTQTNFAHMCGHDGHMASLMSAASVIAANRHKIPKNKGVRLLLQPAEEDPGGALPMVKEGCMKGVDEVYGFHNFPNFDEGDIRVCSGGFFAAKTLVKIRVTG